MEEDELKIFKTEDGYERIFINGTELKNVISYEATSEHKEKQPRIVKFTVAFTGNVKIDC